MGAEGLSEDVPLAHAFLAARALRIADGPDEVHLITIAAHELSKLSKL
jgi:alkylation response protein AidB-like acyl-CoA dehydrogenase